MERVTNLFSGDTYRLEDGWTVLYDGFYPAKGHSVVIIEFMLPTVLPHGTKFYAQK